MNFVDLITDDVKKVLLVEPNFPIANKSRNHSDFLPIGLLKIASYLRNQSIEVKLVRYEHNKNKGQSTLFDTKIDKKDSFDPDLIFVTSIFTYWSKYVKDAVKYCKKEYKKVPVVVGGVYASLMPEFCKKDTGCDYIIEGIIPELENLIPAYDLVNVDYQIIHTTRGCIRKCGFCGTYIIEPDWSYKKSIKDEIVKKNLVFYDNNFLANPYAEDILKELIELKKERKISYIESQSGFDGRVMREKPHLAKLIKDAGFKSPRIAWDHGFISAKAIKKQIDQLVGAGFKAKDISVFMIYNFDIDYNEMEQKRAKCFEWGVQITDCRYRPLDLISDGYNSHKTNGQSDDEYYVHKKSGWTDEKVRSFRRNVRRHNICVRHETDYHSNPMERKRIPQEDAAKYRKMSYDEVKDIQELEAWSPAIEHFID